MAPKDIYTISSSPPRSFATFNISSPLLSPSQNFMNKVPLLCAGIRKIPLPQNATTSLTSASYILKNNSQEVDNIGSFRLSAEETDLPDGKGTVKPKETKSRRSAANEDEETADGKPAKKPRKEAANKDDTAIDGTAVKKTRKPRTKNGEEKPGKDDVLKERAARKPRAKTVDRGVNKTKEKTARKPRAKKTDGDRQTKFLNAQVTKVNVSSAGRDTTSKTKDRPPIEIDPFTESVDYGLVEAVKRRTSWTPPPPTVETISLETPMPIKLLGGRSSVGSIAYVGRGKEFRDLFDKFGFSKRESNTIVKTVSDGAVMRKRKLIELVKTNLSTSSTVAAPKTKAVKKKATTITERATSAYAKEDEEPGKSAPLLQYLSFEPLDRGFSDAFKVPPKPRSKSPIKGVKGTAQAPILLSPESALKRVGNQDFVFGTSSQLAREESPTFLRDVHFAMQASNEIDDDDPFPNPWTHSSSEKTIPLINRNLWSASARDGSGTLLDVEMVDLADTPAITRHFSAWSNSKEDPPEAKQDDSNLCRNVEDLTEASNDKAAVEKPKAFGPVEAAIRLELSSSPSSAKSPVKLPTQAKVASPTVVKFAASKAKKANNAEKPDFEAYTIAQLAKEVASYHFKPVKRRDQMILLLEKCWEGKQRMAMDHLSTDLPLSSPMKTSTSGHEPPPSNQAQAASPRKPRGRPKKDSMSSSPAKPKTKTASVATALARARRVQKDAEAMDEISDSDTPQTPSPPRRHPSQIRTSPLPLQLSSSGCIDRHELSPASSQKRLFTYITAAVRSAPPSTDSSNPNWHEKILLFDPVILEDLTIWLNTGALERAGWDGEVDPKEVKKWCESKSICCLWKANLRGGTRSRY